MENQVELCRRYAAEHLEEGAGAEVVIYEDEGFSGKDLCRPQFQRMLEDSRRRPPDYILCYRLDRISRSVGDFAPLVEDLIRRGIGFVSIKEQFDTSTPMGKAMMYIASVFAQLERETIAERVRDNMLLLARTGRWLGGEPPTGFSTKREMSQTSDGKRKSLCRLQWNPQEMPIAQQIYTQFQKIHSLSAVKAALEEKGISSRNGRPFSAQGIRSVLTNPVYCVADRYARDYFLSQGAQICFSEQECSDENGLLVYNKRGQHSSKSLESGKSSWIVAKGKHRGIISGRDWVELQRALEHKPGITAPKGGNHRALLSGLLYCRRCGERMLAKPRTCGGQFDYICAGKLERGVHACSCQNLNGSETDGQIIHFLQEHLHLHAGIAERLQPLARQLKEKSYSPRSAALQEALDTVEGELNHLAELLSRKELAPPLFQRLNQRAEDLERNRQAIIKDQEQLQMKQPLFSDPKEIAQELLRPEKLLDVLTLQEKQILARLLIQRIWWDGETLQLCCNSGGPLYDRVAL